MCSEVIIVITCYCIIQSNASIFNTLHIGEGFTFKNLKHFLYLITINYKNAFIKITSIDNYLAYLRIRNLFEKVRQLNVKISSLGQL